MRLWENKNVYIVLISNIITIELELWFAIIANIKRALDFSSTLMYNFLRSESDVISDLPSVSTIEIAFVLVGGCYFFLLWLSM